MKKKLLTTVWNAAHNKNIAPAKNKVVLVWSFDGTKLTSCWKTCVAAVPAEYALEEPMRRMAV